MAGSNNSEIQPDHIIIWCDRNMGQAGNNLDTKAVLEKHANVERLQSDEPASDIDRFIYNMNPYLNKRKFDDLVKSPLRMFTVETECLKCIHHSIQAKKRVFLITSGQTGAIIIPQIHQILSGYIYVFCAQISVHEEWSGPYEKDIIFYDDDRGVFARVLADIGAYYLSKAGDIEDTVPTTAAQYYYWARRLIMSASTVDKHNRKDHLNYIESALAAINATPTDEYDTGVPTPQYNSRCDSRPKIYVVDVPVPWIDWDTELMILETYNTSGGLASLTSCLDQVTAFFIVSSKLLPDKILSHERLLRYYYIRGSIKEHSQSESGSKGQDRVTSIDSTDYLVGRLYGDLAQYYRDRAQDALFENQNRTEAKYFLTKSEKCFKILENGILKTLKHYNDLSKS